MTSLLIGTASLLSSSASIVSGLRDLGARIKVLMNPGGGFELRDIDRRRLLAVHRRVECLVGPLNYCLMKCSTKDSYLQKSVTYGRDLLMNIMDWLDTVRFVPSPTEPNVKLLDDATIERLTFYMRELEFMCSSFQGLSAMPSSSSSLSSADHKNSSHQTTHQPSLSGLVKAVSCLEQMRGKTGDLVALQGRFYINRALTNTRLEDAQDGHTCARQEISGEKKWMGFDAVLKLDSMNFVSVAGNTGNFSKSRSRPSSPTGVCSFKFPGSSNFQISNFDYLGINDETCQSDFPIINNNCLAWNFITRRRTQADTIRRDVCPVSDDEDTMLIVSQDPIIKPSCLGKDSQSRTRETIESRETNATSSDTDEYMYAFEISGNQKLSSIGFVYLCRMVTLEVSGFSCMEFSDENLEILTSSNPDFTLLIRNP